MEQWLVTLITLIVVGALGAATRILIQRWSNKTWPHENAEGFLVALSLGAIGGYLSWELPNYIAEWNYGRLGAFVLGYFLPDVVENLLEGFKPK